MSAVRARSRSPGAVGTMSAAPHSPVQAAAAAAAAAADAAARMQELTASSRAAAAARRYAEAGAAEAALRSCAASAETSAHQALHDRHAAELAHLTSQFQSEAENFTVAWGREFEALAAAAGAAEAQLLGRQVAEVDELKARHAAAAAAHPPPLRASPALLDLRRVEAALAGQREFERARQVQIKADALQAAEAAAQGALLGARQRMEEARLAARHTKEQGALGVRLAQAEGEVRLRREGELARMTRRQQAMLATTASSQAREGVALSASLRGALGIKRPSALLALPSIGTSLASPPLLSSPEAGKGGGGLGALVLECIARGGGVSRGAGGGGGGAGALKAYSAQRRRRGAAVRALLHGLAAAAGGPDV